VGRNNVCSRLALKRRVAAARARLYCVALAWCGDEMLADDLAQETMANGIANIRQLRDETRLFPWLYTILNNNWRLHLRGKKYHEELNETMPSEEPGPLSHYHELEVIARVRSAVARLPVLQRQVISLVDLEKLSYCDVADILDIPIGTVMSRVHRARKNLLAKLEDHAADKNTGREHLRIVK
jgi:RNA polymerase sigma-70 factor (ECF subfamily)